MLEHQRSSSGPGGPAWHLWRWRLESLAVKGGAQHARRTAVVVVNEGLCAGFHAGPHQCHISTTHLYLGRFLGDRDLTCIRVSALPSMGFVSLVRKCAHRVGCRAACALLCMCCVLLCGQAHRKCSCAVVYKGGGLPWDLGRPLIGPLRGVRPRAHAYA